MVGPCAMSHVVHSPGHAHAGEPGHTGSRRKTSGAGSGCGDSRHWRGAVPIAPQHGAQTPFRSYCLHPTTWRAHCRGVRIAIGHNKFHCQLPQCTLSVPPAPGAAPGAAC